MGTLISMLNLGVRDPPQRFEARALRGLGLAPDGYVKLTLNQVLAVERHLSTLASALLGALVAAPRRQKLLDSEIKGLSDHAYVDLSAKAAEAWGPGAWGPGVKGSGPGLPGTNTTQCFFRTETQPPPSPPLPPPFSASLFTEKMQHAPQVGGHYHPLLAIEGKLQR